MGTTFYMSPEQTEGAGTDHRTDIWALGVVLYEMITGQRPFKGDYDKAVMYSILNEEPEPITGLRTGVPKDLEAIVVKCLVKPPDDRYQHADELIVDLRAVANRREESSTPQPPIPTPQAWHETPVKLLATACLALIGLSAYLWNADRGPGPTPLRHFVIESNESIHSPVISPDGRYIAYIVLGRPRQPVAYGGYRTGALWIRDLRTGEKRQIEERALAPFWSPDSEQIAFNSSGSLIRTPVDGGSSQTVAPTHPTNFYGGCWSPDGQTIIYSTGGPSRLYRASIGGGEPEPLFETDRFTQEHWLAHPSYPFGSDHPNKVAFAVYDALTDSATLLMSDLESGEITEMEEGNRHVFSREGHWVFERYDPNIGWQLLAKRGKTGADLLSDQHTLLGSNIAYPSVSTNGTLVYAGLGSTSQQLVWADRKGQRMGMIGQPHDQIDAPRVSHDGTRVVVHGTDRGQEDIWVHETDRPVKTRLTFSTTIDRGPRWSRDDLQIAFNSLRAGTWGIYVKSAGGAGEAYKIFDTAEGQNVGDWSDDGRYFLVNQEGDILYLQRSDDSTWEPHELIATDAREINPVFSPEDRYVAYQSDASGRSEVYVTTFPDGSRRWQVSENGGQSPRWVGDELFYVGDEQLYSARVSLDGGFRVIYAEPLFRNPGLGSGFTSYDVAPDGQRFVLVDSINKGPVSVLHIVQNWTEELRDQE